MGDGQAGMLNRHAGGPAATDRGASRGAGSRLLELALADATAAEVRQVLEGLYAGDRPLDRPVQGSMAYRSLVLLANKELRAVLLARNPVEQARAAAGLARLEEQLLIRCLDADDAPPGSEPKADAAAAEPPLSVENGIRAVYELLVRRTPVDAEIQIWKRNLDGGLPFHEFLLLMRRSDEARGAAAGTLLAELSDARFVQIVYETVVGRGVHPRDMESWVERLRAGAVRRDELVATLLKSAVGERERISVPHDGLSCRIMGTRRHFGVADWQRRAEELRAAPPPDTGKAARHSRFHIRGGPRPLVTAIASLYRGAEFIRQFLDNIVGQTIFDDFCELIIVDAASPDGEGSVIDRYLARHPNIRYLRMDYRIGIYDAWNVGVEQARGEYLTNTNLDDLRRADSLELQAATLDNLPFVDVVYQDFLYTFEPHGSPERAAAFDVRSNLPIVTAYNMLSFNSPHNAPMWRRRLHDELGPFDTAFRSAGDYEFWLRCLAAGKVFYKLNDPHVVYFQNPKGLSTRADSRGVIESREIHTRYAARLTPELMTMPREEFDRRFGVNAPADPGRYPPDRYSQIQRRLRQAARTMKFRR